LIFLWPFQKKIIPTPVALIAPTLQVMKNPSVIQKHLYICLKKKYFSFSIGNYSSIVYVYFQQTFFASVFIQKT